MAKSTPAQEAYADGFARANGLVFRDLFLLRQALTHPSYRNEHPEETLDNERLEFLGDAVIDFVAGELLFLRYPDMPEGDLTRLRASIVRTDSLAEIGSQIGVGGALKMGKGEEANGGRTRANNVCAAFEAVIGALYLDSGMDAARDFATPLLIERLKQVQAASLDRDSRSIFQERAQAVYGKTPEYKVIAESGPDHAKEFTVVVMVGDTQAGQGVGRSKQLASQDAARDALEKMR